MIDGDFFFLFGFLQQCRGQRRSQGEKVQTEIWMVDVGFKERIEIISITLFVRFLGFIQKRS